MDRHTTHRCPLHAQMHTCVHTPPYALAHTCTPAHSMHAHTCTYPHTCTLAHVHTPTCTYTRIPTQLHTHAYFIPAHTRTHTHTHTHARIHTRTHLHTCAHIDVVSGCNVIRLKQKQHPTPVPMKTPGPCLPVSPVSSKLQSMGVLSCKLNICKKAVINAISYLHDGP